MMGILVLAATLLEKKLSTKRLMILLEKWFNPIDDVVDEARNLLRNRYRIVSRKRNIENEGPGIRLTIPTEELPTSEQLMEMEDKMEDNLGMPVRIMALSPDEIQSTKLTWVVTITPKDKKSSEMNKLMFSAMIGDAMALGLRLNPNWLEDEFTSVWERDSSKMFQRGEEAPEVAPGQAGQAPGQLPTAPRPQIKAPQVGGGQPAGALR